MPLTSLWSGEVDKVHAEPDVAKNPQNQQPSIHN